MEQQALSMTGYFDKGKKTRREQFLSEMNLVVPWARLCALIEPHYPKGSRAGGRPPLSLERMFRIYCLQQWYNLSDPGAEEALYDSIAMRQFAGVRTDADIIPDETSILNFRRLLEKHKLTELLLSEINAHLCERGLFVGKGTIVDATIINAPSSTKNAEKKRDPQMHQTRKVNQWYFGMKVHTGTDTDSGLVHTVRATSANVADVNLQIRSRRSAWRLPVCFVRRSTVRMRLMPLFTNRQWRAWERPGSGKNSTPRNKPASSVRSDWLRQ